MGRPRIGLALSSGAPRGCMDPGAPNSLVHAQVVLTYPHIEAQCDLIVLAFLAVPAAKARPVSLPFTSHTTNASMRTIIT